jgi:superfamily II DNA/RNA helicase
MPPEITRLADQFLKEPARVEVAKPATTAKTITQKFHFCPDGEDWAKRDMLRNLIRSEDVKNAIIFCNRKRDVAILLKSLQKHGFNAGALHGDMDQSSRMETLDKFRSGAITLLAASDVAARGLDIPDVSHVFNFDIPWQSDDYVHRIGRTGRAGKHGTSCSIVTHEDLKSFKDIEKMLGEPVIWIGDGPTDDDLANAGKRRRGRGGRGGRDSHESRGRDRHGRGHSESRDRGPRREERRDDRGDRGERSDERGDRGRPDMAARGREGHRQHRHEERHERHDRSAEHRAPRPPREGAAPPDAASHGPRHDQRPRPERTRAERPATPAHPARAQSQPREEPRARGDAARGPSAPAAGFADNVPAFLRKPPRPLKTANE